MKLVIDIPEESVDKISKIRFLIGGKEDRNLQLSVIEAIKNGTPLEEKQTNTAEWEYNSFSNKWRCTKCFQSNNEKTNYCPNCGKRMKGDTE